MRLTIPRKGRTELFLQKKTGFIQYIRIFFFFSFFKNGIEGRMLKKTIKSLRNDTFKINISSGRAKNCEIPESIKKLQCCLGGVFFVAFKNMEVGGRRRWVSDLKVVNLAQIKCS